ncbi:MAG TPA: response regulator [Planctomycetaceae bacterium]|jgi:response regulator NasT|nr:response regulator [Planctomycetaceae bacterium]
MINALRIVVADDEPDVLEHFKECLEALGHQVVAAVGNGADLVERCRALHPDLVITDIKMPDLDGIQAAEKVRLDHPTPVILVSAYHDPDLIDRALADHVLAYLVKPIRKDNLKPAIALAMQRFKEFQALQHQADDLRQALEDRKIVERAKGILMKRGNLDEQSAFTRLQKLASDKNRKMVEIARMIVTAEEAFTADD